jgi:hypothetical protein
MCAERYADGGAWRLGKLCHRRGNGEGQQPTIVAESQLKRSETRLKQLGWVFLLASEDAHAVPVFGSSPFVFGVLVMSFKVNNSILPWKGSTSKYDGVPSSVVPCRVHLIASTFPTVLSI